MHRIIVKLLFFLIPCNAFVSTIVKTRSLVRSTVFKVAAETSAGQQQQLSFLDNLFQLVGIENFLNKEPEESSKKDQLKLELLQICSNVEFGDAKSKRGAIEDLIEQLSPLSPVDNTASSPLLQKKWILEWTTEKEINLFSDLGISGQVYQTIRDGNVLENVIEFKRGGELSVCGSLSISDTIENTDNDEGMAGYRTYFTFTNASLDLGKWGSYSLPPVGKGWFDTIYLDKDLRVDVNSRNDILICTST